jgi:PAS domain S-box-containing protein
MNKKAAELVCKEIPIVLITINNNKKITYWNHKAEEVFGIPRVSVIGKQLYRILPNIKKRYAMFINNSCLKEGRSIEILDLKFKHANNKSYLEGKGQFLPILQQKKVTGVSIIINVFQNGERYDPEFQELINSVVQNSKDAVLITKAVPYDNPDGPRIIFANPAFYKMTGYKEADILGRTPRILQGKNSDPNKIKEISKALKEWKPIRTELTNYTKSGKEFIVELSIVPVKNKNGWYTHWISIQRDTTDRVKMVNQLIQYNKNLESLVSKKTKEREKLILAKKKKELDAIKAKSILNALKLSTANKDLELRKKKLLSQEMQISGKEAQLSKVKEKLEAIRKQDSIQKKDIDRLIRSIESQQNEEKNWINFSNSFNEIDPMFFKKLVKKCKTLTLNDKKHAAYVRLNLSLREVSKILHIEQKSAEMARYRLKKKLKIKPEDALSSYILSL